VWVRRCGTDVDMDMVMDMDKGGWAEWAEEGAGVEPTDTDKMGARGAPLRLWVWGPQHDIKGHTRATNPMWSATLEGSDQVRRSFLGPR
jgi:hypothetical protein